MVFWLSSWLAEERVWGSRLCFLEIGYLLLLCHDMTEMLK